MTVFLSTRSDGLINADHIVKLRTINNMASSVKHGHRVLITVAVLKDGKTQQLSYDLSECVKACSSVIPAYPGFEVLSAWYNAETGKPEVWRIPIVGWRTVESGLEPVTPDEDFEMSATTAIRYPDGQVNVPFDLTFPDEEDWLKALLAEEIFEPQKTEKEQLETAKAAS